MDIGIHHAFLPHTEPDASLAFWGDTLGSEVRNGAEVLQEPTAQPCGMRDCGFRDPSGNLIRINEVG